MRSLPLLAATTVIVMGAWACGDNGSGTQPNTDPVANFTAPSCTVGVPCAFTDQSSDPDGSVTGWSWDFGDGSPLVTDKNPTHTYTTAGTFNVTLTVTDNGEKTNTKIVPVTVGGGTTNQPPVASFDVPTSCTAGTPCGFHSTSTDPDGTIAAAHWDFGDTSGGDGVDVTHTYGAPGTYSVTLTVTDNGGATGTVTQQLTVSPATSADCTTAGTQVNCSLTMSQQGKLTFTIVSSDCELGGNTLKVTAPRAQTVFFNLCSRTAGETYTLKDASGADQVLAAGTVVVVAFVQGTPGLGDPPTSDPGIRIDGGSPSWTLNIDDGGAAGTPGEPDFNDAVVSVQITP